MKQFWITFFGSIVGVIVGSVLTVILAIFMIAGLIASAIQSGDSSAVPLPGRHIVLELDLRADRLDQPSRSPFAFAEPASTVEIVQALHRAETDNRIDGLFIRANEFGMSPGQAEELHRAFASLRAAGKFVIVHAQGFEGTAITNYFAVAGADEIWLQDTANFTAVGLSTETPFLGGVFERFGVQPEFVQFYEFKNAANIFTQSDYTEAHREATLSYMQSIFDTGIAAIAADRGMEAVAMEALITSGPYSAEQALQSGLVDQLGQVFAAREAVRARSPDANFLDIEDYVAANPAARGGSGPVIAIVSGQGNIVTGGGQAGFNSGDMIGGDAMADAIDAAAADDRVRAIVIRVDSGGGSAIASDQIWDSVVRAREAGKPVVVSMGSVAASGGYYLAAPANLILANATTITGSIGMLAGKFVLDDAMNSVGLNIEPLSIGGEYALAFSSQTAWSDSQRQAFYDLAEDVYEDFTERVAEGRDLPLTRVQEIARGRVWTGAQALEIGLVDRIGGLTDAIAAARELAGLAEDEDVSVRSFPRQLTPMEAFQQLFGMTTEGAEAAAQLNALMALPEVQAALEARRQAGARGVQLSTTAPSPR